MEYYFVETSFLQSLPLILPATGVNSYYDCYTTSDEISPKDVNGDKIPDIVVQEIGDGMFPSYTILSLGEYFFQYDIPYNAPIFSDLDDDGIIE